jgi:diguanylate cyclase (GGDEF)-like protein
MNLLPHRQDQRVESEEGQAHFRFLAGLLALGAYAVVAAASPSVSVRTVSFVSLYTVYSYTWLWVVAHGLGRPATRRWVALFLDVVIFATCIAAAGRATAALSWVPVTTSVGHGLRFGERKGVVAAVLGGLGLFLAVRFGPDWQLPISVALGVAITAVVAPIYVVSLVRTINRQRDDAETRSRELELAVSLDGLTGVLSRSGFESIWAELCDANGFTETAVGLVYLDLDGFKAVNDTLGHEAGDKVLQRVARLLVGSVRHSDAVARLGGDEFVILVRSPAGEADVRQVASKAVEAIREFSADPLSNMKVGASAGIAYSRVGASMASMLRLADEQMFAAKHTSPSRSARTASSIEPPDAPV